MPGSSDLITASDVIERLTRMPARLRRLAVTCVLPAVRVGDEWRFRRSDLERWIGQTEATDVAAGELVAVTPGGGPAHAETGRSGDADT